MIDLSLIMIAGTAAVILSNRAGALSGQEKWVAALADATRACKLDPGYLKAVGRVAACNARLGRYVTAAEDYGRVNEICEGMGSAEGFAQVSFQWKNPNSYSGILISY